MAGHSATGHPCHNSSCELSCSVQGPDKGHFLPHRPGCFWYHKKMTAANPAVRCCMSPSPISVGHAGELPSVVFISHSCEGKARHGGDALRPRWVLLINMRNGTRGYEALNWSVISYMGFAKCLSPDN